MLQRQLVRCLPALNGSLFACSREEVLRSCELRWHAQPFSEAAAAEAGGPPFCHTICRMSTHDLLTCQGCYGRVDCLPCKCSAKPLPADASERPGRHSDPRTDKWFKDPSIGALEAAKILRTRLERFGPQSGLRLPAWAPHPGLKPSEAANADMHELGVD